LKDGTSVSKTSWIDHNPTAQTFTLSSPIDADLGATFTVKMDASIVDPSTNTTKTSSLSFTITTVDDCLTTLLSGTVANMSTNVNVSAVTQTLSFTVSSSPTIPSWSTCCGAMTYTLSPASSFLSISGTTMSLTTTNASDVGVRSMALKVAIANYPTINLTRSFTVTINCLI